MKPTKEMLEVGAFAAMVSNCCGVMVEGDRVMCDDVRLGDDREERCRCREDFTAGLTAALSALPAGVKPEATEAQKRVYRLLAEEGGGTWAIYMMMDIEAAWALSPAGVETETPSPLPSRTGESLPCYCAATTDHSIGQEQAHPAPQTILAGILQKIADEISALKLHPTTCEEYDAGYIGGRGDAFAIVHEAIDALSVDPKPEPLLSVAEQKEQAKRCSCHGSDDYCPCQNVPDATTRRLREAAQAAVDTGGLPIKVERELRAALATTEGK